MAEYVLVVDDDAAIRRIVHDILSGEGCPVRSAANGREALEQIAGELPLVVLLDLWMPVVDGWGVVKELRARALDVPVVVMTAGRDAAGLAAEVEAQGHLAKPFTIDDLLTAVAPFLASPPQHALPA